MSSCVYSLFPIYTEDTIMYKPELNGTYQNGNTTIKFAPGTDIEITSLQVTSDNPDEYYVSNGDTIRDMKLVSEAIMSEFEQELADNAKFYKMTIIEKNDESKNEIQEFRTHLVKIDDEYFLDLYPYVHGEGIGRQEGKNKYVYINVLPVHTFMKIEFENDKLALTQFNLSKLRDLFKSNLIRLRHEMLENEVLITAQPKEIQKFIQKYSRDPSVYEKTETYDRVAI